MWMVDEWDVSVRCWWNGGKWDYSKKTLCQRYFFHRRCDGLVQDWTWSSAGRGPQLSLWILCFFCTVHCDTTIKQKPRKCTGFKLRFNFCCLLHVSNLVDSSSGRKLYLQCGMFYLHRHIRCMIHTRHYPHSEYWVFWRYAGQLAI